MKYAVSFFIMLRLYMSLLADWYGVFTHTRQGGFTGIGDSHHFPGASEIIPKNLVNRFLPNHKKTQQRADHVHDS